MINKCVIDIGSNTIKIFIAKLDSNNEVYPVVIKRRMTRLSKNVGKDGYLDDHSKDLVIKYLEEYLKMCNKHNLAEENILITATAACRNAVDGTKFIKNLKTKYNLKNIKILSGKEEAKYTFFGVLDNIKENNNEKYCVIDIGGGSFQIAGGTKDKFNFGTSIQKGCSQATELFELNKPVTKDVLLNAIEYFSQLEIDGLPFKYKPAKIIGVGGTLKIMQIMLKDKDDPSPLTIEELISTGDWLASQTITERFEWFKNKFADKKARIDAGLTINRAEVILAGVCITIGILKKLQAEEIYMSNTDAKNYIIKLSRL